MNAPSAWTIQSVLAIAHATLARMEAEGVVPTYEADLLAHLRDDGADVETLLLRFARARQEAQKQAKLLEETIADLTTRRNRFKRRFDEYHRALYAILDLLGMKNWNPAEYTAYFVAGRPGVVVTDEAALPDAYTKIERVPDRAAIKAALEAGEVVPGAEMANNAPTLTVRTK